MVFTRATLTGKIVYDCMFDLRFIRIRRYRKEVCIMFLVPLGAFFRNDGSYNDVIRRFHKGDSLVSLTRRSLTISSKASLISKSLLYFKTS